MAGKQPKRTPRPGVDEYGRIPLHYAAVEGNTEAVQTQLAAGASADAQDDNGWTALHFAAQDRRVEVVRILLAGGANPNLIDRHGNGPLWTAVMNARGDNTIMELLLAHGADAERKNAHGRSPRDVATTIGHGLERPFGKSSGLE